MEKNKKLILLVMAYIAIASIAEIGKDFIGLIPTFLIVFAFFFFFTFGSWRSLFRTVFPGRGYRLPSEFEQEFPETDENCDIRVDSGARIEIPVILADINITWGYNNIKSLNSIYYNAFANCVGVPSGVIKENKEEEIHNLIIDISKMADKRKKIIILMILPPVVYALGFSMIFVATNYSLIALGIIFVILGFLIKRYLEEVLY